MASTSLDQFSSFEQPKLQQWMKHLPSQLHDVPISELAIPGSHDSFAFALSSSPGPDLDRTLRCCRFFILPVIKRWSLTQRLGFREQLAIGIRYFDLRICPTVDARRSSKSLFSFTHGLIGDLVRPKLEEINEFLHENPQEIVLLDFNHFYDFNEKCGHQELIDLIHVVFGEKLCTTAKTIHECTLNYLWQRKQQVILLYELNPDQCSVYMDRVGHFFQICQSPWPNTPRVNELFTFLNEKVAESQPTHCINVVQGQITPDGATIQSNPFSSLERMAQETNRQLLEWLKNRYRNPSIINGVNVVICDFVDQSFVNAVISLNYKTLS